MGLYGSCLAEALPFVTSDSGTGLLQRQIALAFEDTHCPVKGQPEPVDAVPVFRKAGMDLLEGSFRGRPLMTLIDPSRVSPAALDQLARAAGPALATSSHWLRTEGIRMLARSSLKVATEPERATDITQEFEEWMRNLGALAPTQAKAVA